jgi:hypothetical protein
MLPSTAPLKSLLSGNEAAQSEPSDGRGEEDRTTTREYYTP